MTRCARMVPNRYLFMRRHCVTSSQLSKKCCKDICQCVPSRARHSRCFLEKTPLGTTTPPFCSTHMRALQAALHRSAHESAVVVAAAWSGCGGTSSTECAHCRAVQEASQEPRHATMLARGRFQCSESFSHKSSSLSGAILWSAKMW